MLTIRPLRTSINITRRRHTGILAAGVGAAATALGLTFGTGSRYFAASARIDMQAFPLLARSDNWMYLVVDDATKQAAVVDPYDWKKMWKLVEEKGVTVTTLLTTHHHDDHSGGNKQFLAHAPPSLPPIKAYAGSHSPGTNTLISDNSTFRIGDGINVRCMHTPCHTQDSICYYLEDGKGAKGVFTGDTLFMGGCGRFFEGTPSEMHRSLQYLMTLPNSTTVYNGHEYTASSARFGASVDPSNERIRSLVALADKRGGDLAGGGTTGRTTIGDEKEWNVFVRAASAEVKRATGVEKDGEEGDVERVGKLREMKNKA